MDYISTKSIADFYSEFFELFRFDVSPKLRHVWAARLKDKIKPKYWEGITTWAWDFCSDLMSITPGNILQVQNNLKYEEEWKVEHANDGEVDR